MAKAQRGNEVLDASATDEAGSLPAIEGEKPLDGMPDIDPDLLEEGDTRVKRPQVPRELRTLYKEVERLSSFLGMARRAIYAGQPEKAAKALALLEKATPDAREIAELSAD